MTKLHWVHHRQVPDRSITGWRGSIRRVLTRFYNLLPRGKAAQCLFVGQSRRFSDARVTSASPLSDREADVASLLFVPWAEILAPDSIGPCRFVLSIDLSV